MLRLCLHLDPCALQVIKEAVYDAFYKLTDSSSQIRSYVFDVVRATVPNMLLDDVRASPHIFCNPINLPNLQDMFLFIASQCSRLAHARVPAAC